MGRLYSGALRAPVGQVLVEVEGPQASSGRTRLRLASGNRISRPFPWAHLALRDAGGAAALAGMGVDDFWQDAGRWFVTLRPA